jgi:GTP pyrophosphokinase
MESGDTVEILTSPNQTPHKDWLKFVRTSRAKTKIKHWIKSEEEKRSIEVGRRLLESEFKRHGLTPAKVLKSDQWLEVARHAGYGSADELAAAVGFGHVATAQIVSKLVAPEAESDLRAKEPVASGKIAGAKSDDKGVQVQGARDLLMQLSRCCNPVPGDRILGYITRGRGLTIHAVDCPNLEALDYDRARLVEVGWDITTPSHHAVKVSIIAVDKTGVLAHVSAAISECSANISRAEITTREDRKAMLDFVIEITDTAHLNRVLKSIEKVDGVITARRIRAWQEKQ